MTPARDKAVRRASRRCPVAIAVAIAALLAPSHVAAQCAMCSTAIGSSASVARGFAISILFLLSTLFLLVLGFVLLVVRRAHSAGVGDRSRVGAGHRLAAFRWRLLLRRSAPSSPSP